MKALRRVTTAALAVSLLSGAVAMSAPAASAASAASRLPSKCTAKEDFYNWVDTDFARLRTGPSTSYTVRGLMREGDRMKFSCSNGRWLYGKVLHSKSGIKGYGWIREDMLLNYN
ncbi:hypothetical protein DKG71_00480 [Streptomyces sp. NEAU-S7GS2]|nr:hypothetical protein DKG71_00480 [Streptomyces sp. NEAU-S7GS2]